MAANLVISEFLASNSTGIKDSFGEREDWIELHNAGNAAANLNDYFITDDATNLQEYRLPTQTLAAGGYLVIFASGLNEVTAGGEIHTNFKLSASGEYLGLINAADNSVQFDYAPTFPAQSTDISYGLFDANDPSSAKTFFNTPTPGAANSPTAAPVSYSVNGKTFTGSLSVSLSDTTSGAKIYYTIDGTVPTSSSALYTSALTLTNTTMLRSVAYATGLGSSLVTSQSYIALNNTASTTATLGSSTAASFSSNLPIVMLNTFGTTISDTVDNAASISLTDTTAGTANALDASNYIGRTGFRVRGSTSESYPKQQYAIELWDESNNGKNAALLGMPAESDWILYAPYTEQIMMQNALAYQWANETGHYASRTRYVELFLNTSSVTAGGTAAPTSGADYVGIYILQEKVKIDDNRVNIGPQISDTNLNGGFIVNQDRTTNESYFTTTGYGVKLVNADPNAANITSTQKTAIAGAWNSFETALMASDFADPNSVDYYGKFINVNSFVDYFIVNEMTRNIDSFWLSTFYNKAPDTVVNGALTQRGLISAGPVWDFNLSLGSADYNFAANSAGWDTDTLTPAPGAVGVTGFNPQDPYFQRLLTDPNFKQAIGDRWEQLRTGVFSTAKLMSDIDANVSILANGTTNYPVGAAPSQPATDPIVRNFIRWPELGTAVTTNGLYDPAGSWIADVNLTKNWLTARVNWMDSQFIPAPTLTPGGQSASPTLVSMLPIGPVSTSDTQLIGPNATVYYKVPSANIAGWQNLSATTLPAGWTQGTDGIGYDTTTTGTGAISFLPYISTNVQSSMYRTRATVYTLTNFTVSDPTQIQALILKAYYDDGFIVWINGVRVMDAYSPENTTNPSFTTTASINGNDSLAITNREFDITSIKSLLKVGNNTLAIQGLNLSSSNDDFLLAPTLYSRTYSYPAAGSVYYTTDGTDPRSSSGSVSGTAQLYTAALSLSSSAKIQARTLINGVWSALATQTYNLSSDPLRITELMYDPPDNQNYEFIKVQNIDTLPLSLNGYTFTNGVTFAFPNVTLAAGASAVIIKDPASFTSRYGSAFNVLGTYTGSLDNSGETVAFADSFGTTVQSFKYDSTWYPDTKGLGSSLVIRDPAGDKTNWGVAGGWKASLDDSPPVVSTTSAGLGSKFNIDVTFAQTLNAQTSLSAMTLTNLTTGAAIPTSSLIPTTSGTDLLVGYTGGSLPDGWYSMTIPAGGVKTAGGVPLASAYTFRFFVLAGDANHDGKVDVVDLGIVSSNWQKTGETFAQGDFNYDGQVDVVDLGVLSSNWQKSLPASPTIVVAPVKTIVTPVKKTAVSVNGGIAPLTLSLTAPLTSSIARDLLS